MSDEKTFGILALDGGGWRGLFAAHLLGLVQARLGAPWGSHISLAAGTSTGAVAAAACAVELDLSTAVASYRARGSRIFPARATDRLPYWKELRATRAALYGAEPLAEALLDIFGEGALGHATVPLLICASDLSDGGARLFRSYESEDHEVPIREAVAASCAAPLYFPPTRVRGVPVFDGAVWANNPALAAMVEAERAFGVARGRIRVLSLGTGIEAKSQTPAPDKPWGLMRGWGGLRMMDFLMRAQASATHGLVSTMLAPHQVLRLDFTLETLPALDDASPRASALLIAQAEAVFAERELEILAFLRAE